MALKEKILILYFKLRSGLIGFLYRFFAKPIFFQFDPENIHEFFTTVGEFLGRHNLTRQLTKIFFHFKHPNLEQNICGLKFKNPVGLAAGFDKDARLTSIMAPVGFGYEEVGSVTGEPCEGNPRPRLWRLSKSQSLIVNYGLKNDGAEKIAHRLTGKNFDFPLGVSIAKTNSPDTVEITAGIFDYFKAYKTFIDAGIGDYFTINISCPNAFGGQPFTDPVRLDLLMAKLMTIPKSKPIFLKMPPDISTENIDAIITLAEKYNLDGFVCTNLTKDRNNTEIEKNILDPLPTKVGGLSGKVIQPTTLRQVQYIHQKTGDRFTIIACGGIFNAEDAYEYLKAGASLLQLVTGLIYEGPQMVGEINQGLVRLMARDGYKNISQVRHN